MRRASLTTRARGGFAAAGFFSWLLLALTVACGRSDLEALRDGGSVSAGGSGASVGVGGADGGSSAGGSAGSAGAGVGGAGGSGAEGASAGSGGSDLDGGIDAGVLPTSDKLDLLLVVDNSRGILDKQRLLSASLSELVAGLSDAARRRAAPFDVHIGVISSSLGAHGGNICGPEETQLEPSKNDRAHLIPTLRPGVPDHNEYGFLELELTPDFDWQRAVVALAAAVEAVGDTGCGFEAPLEAMNRFLADPDPPLDVVVVDGQAVPTGLDTELLEQRRHFLRADSAVAILLLSDENDCSVRDEGQAYLSSTSSIGSSDFFMPHGTSACEQDPNDICCFSCRQGVVPAGCLGPENDKTCLDSAQDLAYDNLSLRCFQQKRRFGIDWLYPISRYVAALSSETVVNHAGQRVANPLLVNDAEEPVLRDPRLITFGSIVGVPWQDLATSLADEPLEFMPATELEASGRWPIILGDPAQNVAPKDPFMRESSEQRGGKNPLTNDRLVPARSNIQHANAINGHEFFTEGGDLQYACTYPLTLARDCSVPPEANCDCRAADAAKRRPVCEHEVDGTLTTLQTDEKAYPGQRYLELARALGEQATVGSICPKQTSDMADASYGLKPAIRLFARRFGDNLL